MTPKTVSHFKVEQAKLNDLLQVLDYTVLISNICNTNILKLDFILVLFIYW